MNFSSSNINTTITDTVVQHRGSPQALAQSIIGIFTMALENEKKAWDRVNQKKIDKKLKKEAGCCFSLCCCQCFNGSYLCKFIMFILFFGFIVRFVQNVVGYFK